MSKFRVPGFSLAIARHGQMVYQQGFGFADNSTAEKVTPSHLFRIASVTKPITAAAIFSLIEKGRLQLGERIFCPDGALGFDYASSYSDWLLKITLEHLLTHTCGGWSNDRNDPMFRDPAMELGDLIKWALQNQPLSDEPGTKWAYSNFGYCLLGRVLEKVSGRFYADCVQRAILTPSGVTAMRLSGNTRADRAPGEVVYYGQDGEDPYACNIRRMDSHGGWLATPADLVRFALRVDGFPVPPDILRPETIRVMTTPCPVFPHYAKGWNVNEVPNWWHEGSLPGTCTILVRTASGLCWAALANTRVDDIGDAIDRLMWDVVLAVPAWRA